MPRASARLRCPWAVAGPGRTTSRRAQPHASTPGPTGVEGTEGLAAVPVGGGRAWPGFEKTRRANHQYIQLHLCGGRRRVRRARAGFEIDHSEPQARVWRSRGRPGPPAPRTPAGQQATQSRPAPQGPGGSRVRPLGGSQRRFQRIWVPSEPRRWQASTTRAAMPASADLPHVRGSYCFFTPTSPSILRTPS